MKVLISILLLITASSFIFITEYKNEECGFSINFPGKPKDSTITYYDPIKYDLKIFTYTPDDNSKDENSSYEVRYAQTPMGMLDKLSKEKVHEMMYSSIGNAAHHPNTILLSKKILDSDNYFCEEYEIQNKANSEFGYIKVYVVKNKLYQLFVVTKNKNNPGIVKFLSSFKLIE